MQYSKELILGMARHKEQSELHEFEEFEGEGTKANLDKKKEADSVDKGTDNCTMGHNEDSEDNVAGIVAN